MNKTLLLLISAISLLTTAGEKGPWLDLFADGDFSQWQQVNGKAVGNGWRIEDGVVHRHGLAPGGIVTKTSYHDFELRFEWKISKAGNSGVKYRTQGKLGLEYQILDDERHQDSKKPNHRAASLYDLVAAPADKPMNAVGSWNEGAIIVKDNRIQHFLNGAITVDLVYGSEEWTARFAESKYKAKEGFGSWTGPILLQDHKDPVWFRNVRIRTR